MDDVPSTFHAGIDFQCEHNFCGTPAHFLKGPPLGRAVVSASKSISRGLPCGLERHMKELRRSIYSRCGSNGLHIIRKMAVFKRHGFQGNPLVSHEISHCVGAACFVVGFESIEGERLMRNIFFQDRSSISVLCKPDDDQANPADRTFQKLKISADLKPPFIIAL